MINLLISVSLLVSPMRIEVTTLPGVVTKEIIVKNADKFNESRVVIYEGDWRLDPWGVVSYFPPGSLTTSCSDWISINPREFTLPPGEQEIVRVSFDVPPETEGSFWSVIFIEGKPPEREEWTPLIQLTGRIGVSTYVEIAGTVMRQATIKDMKVEDNSVIVEFYNEGNHWVRPEIKLWISRGKEKIYSDSVKTSLVLPESRRYYKFNLDDLELHSGDSIITQIDYGGEKILLGIKDIKY